MQIIETHTPRGLKMAASALLATALLAGSLAPASAAAFSGNAGPDRLDAPRTAFHHHFYRGVPGQNRDTDDDADLSAISADAGAQEEAAVAYCADRYRSYDPASGTYLGYDGNEHACP